MLNIKIALAFLAVVGLFISLGEMLGWFRDKDRLALVAVIQEKLECPKDHPGAAKFINDFVLSNPDYTGIDIGAEVDKVVFVGLWLGDSADQTGRHVDSLTSGTLKLKSHEGHVSKALCSLQDLKDWSKQSPFWKWLGWGIVAGSVALGIVLLIIEEIVKRRGTI